MDCSSSTCATNSSQDVVGNSTSLLVELVNRLELSYYPPTPQSTLNQFFAQAALLLLLYLLVFAGIVIRMRSSERTWLFRRHRTEEGRYIVPNAKMLCLLMIGLVAVLSEVSVVMKIGVFKFRHAQYGFSASRTFVWIPVYYSGLFLAWHSLHATSLNSSAVVLPNAHKVTTKSFYSRFVRSPYFLNSAFFIATVVPLVVLCVFFSLSTLYNDQAFTTFLKLAELVNSGETELSPLASGLHLAWHTQMKKGSRASKIGFVFYTVAGAGIIIGHTVVAIILLSKLGTQINILRSAGVAAMSVARVEAQDVSQPSHVNTVTGGGYVFASPFDSQLRSLTVLRRQLRVQIGAVIALGAPLEIIVMIIILRGKQGGPMNQLTGPMEVLLPTWIFVTVSSVVAALDLTVVIRARSRENAPKKATPLTSDDVYANWEAPKVPYAV